jgi:hypothetical protein
MGTFDLTRSLMRRYLGKDSLGIAQLLADYFKKRGLTHLNGQYICIQKTT